MAELAIVVGVRRDRETRSNAEESLQELKLLAESAGAAIVGRVFCDLESINPSTFIGKGKVSEISSCIEETGADLVIIDDTLSPAQQRTLENQLNSTVLDRTGIILDIFAKRAQSREGIIQVELAQKKYMLPRLTHLHAHLSRLGGGIGTRGPGETQLEYDRRRIRTSLRRLEEELDKVRKRRGLQRSGRRKAGYLSISLVGYTNAGKSTLMNLLTGASVDVRDQLFATLDPTIRLLELPNKQRVILSDTVGFISKLPHELVAAFRATLEEVVEADLLLHVIDNASESRDRQISEVNRTLKELKIEEKPILLIFNKIDRTPNMLPGFIGDIDEKPAVAISSKTGMGIPELLEWIARFDKLNLIDANIELPYNRGDVLSELQRNGRVDSINYSNTSITCRARIPLRLAEQYREFIR